MQINAKKIFEDRKGKNENLALLECLQLADKKKILSSTKGFLEKFRFSKSQLQKLFKNIEDVRNDLAHSQSSIISHLEWKLFVKTRIGMYRRIFKRIRERSRKTRMQNYR